MKKILIFIVLTFNFYATAISKETTFTNEIFEKSQLEKQIKTRFILKLIHYNNLNIKGFQVYFLQ